MRKLTLALIATALAAPALAGALDPGILLRAPEYPRPKGSCDWSRAHIVFNNNTKTPQTAQVWYLSDVEAAKAAVNPIASITVAPGREDKLFLQTEKDYIVHSVIMRGTQPVYGTSNKFQFPTCEKPGTSVAYMWTWTKNEEVALFVRKK
jgi:hypothetical protein